MGHALVGVARLRERERDREALRAAQRERDDLRAALAVARATSERLRAELDALCSASGSVGGGSSGGVGNDGSNSGGGNENASAVTAPSTCTPHRYQTSCFAAVSAASTPMAAASVSVAPAGAAGRQQTRMFRAIIHGDDALSPAAQRGIAHRQRSVSARDATTAVAMATNPGLVLRAGERGLAGDGAGGSGSGGGRGSTNA
ncbi:unnamed protein product, partial [Phaeothamnion confervicola]